MKGVMITYGFGTAAFTAGAWQLASLGDALIAFGACMIPLCFGLFIRAVESHRK